MDKLLRFIKWELAPVIETTSSSGEKRTYEYGDRYFPVRGAGTESDPDSENDSSPSA